MRLPRLLVLASLLLSPGTGSAGQSPGATPLPGGSAPHSAIVARLDASLLAAKPLAAPQVFALGGLGIPNVITWAGTTGTSGLAWGSTASITAANAYLTYDATTAVGIVLNAPVNKKVIFDIAGTNRIAVASSGLQFSLTTLAAPAAATAGISYDGSDMIVNTPTGKQIKFNTAGTTGGELDTDGMFYVSYPRAAAEVAYLNLGTSQTALGRSGSGPSFVADATGAYLSNTGSVLAGASIVAVLSGGGITLSPITATVLVDGQSDNVQLTVQGFASQTALPFVVETSAGTDQFTVSNAGAVVALGTYTGTAFIATSATVPAASLAYVDYNGTDLILNVPTGKGFILTANGVTFLQVGTVGELYTKDDVIVLGGDVVFNDTSVFIGEIGATNVLGVNASGGTQIVGTADVVQLRVTGYSTQTSLPFVVENSIGTDVATISNTGILTVASCVGCGGTGDVVGPSSATDNALARFDTTTGKLLQDSVITMGDTGAATLTIGGTNPKIVFTNTNATEFDCNGTCNFADAVTSSGVVTGTVFTGTTTTSPSTFGNGTSVYFGSSGVLAGVIPAVLNTNTTAVGNVGAGPDVLQTLTLNVNSLQTTKRELVVVSSGTFANNANAKTLTCYIGTQAVLTHAPTASVAGEQWQIVTRFTRTGNSTQDWYSVYEGNTGAAGVFDFEIERGTATQDDTATMAIYCEATTVTNTDDIVQEYQSIEAGGG